MYSCLSSESPRFILFNVMYNSHWQRRPYEVITIMSCDKMQVNNALIPWNVFESGVSVLIQNEKDWEVFVKLETSAQYMTYIYIWTVLRCLCARAYVVSMFLSVWTLCGRSYIGTVFHRCVFACAYVETNSREISARTSRICWIAHALMFHHHHCQWLKCTKGR